MATTETHADSHPIQTYLDQCNGSDELFFDPLFGRRVQYTTGVKVCRDNGCNWLIVAILSHLPTFRGEDFVVAELTINGKSANLIFSDGNDRILAKQAFQYADAPCNLTFYFENGVLMLDRER
ncbi:MAG: hypothetical protein HY915_10080 [Desulfovibrio sp.]|nr:hypothetical protein [Desulfovibrio sp.]